MGGIHVYVTILLTDYEDRFETTWWSTGLSAREPRFAPAEQQ
jgi:hypothetical protein